MWSVSAMCIKRKCLCLGGTKFDTDTRNAVHRLYCLGFLYYFFGLLMRLGLKVVCFSLPLLAFVFLLAVPITSVLSECPDGLALLSSSYIIHSLLGSLSSVLSSIKITALLFVCFSFMFACCVFPIPLFVVFPNHCFRFRFLRVGFCSMKHSEMAFKNYPHF